MSSLSEKIDELLADDITVEDLDSEISRTTARLAVLQTLKKQIDTVAEILVEKVVRKASLSTSRPTVFLAVSAAIAGGRFATGAGFGF